MNSLNSPPNLIEAGQRCVTCGKSRDEHYGQLRSCNVYPTFQAERSTVLLDRRDTLFDAIKHGDEDHKAWLQEAIDAHFAGEPVPEPRGKGNKEARIEHLSQTVNELREALEYILALTQREDISEGGKVLFVATKARTALNNSSSSRGDL